MQSIYIAEDNHIQRQLIRHSIENYIMIEDLALEVALDCPCPKDLLTYLEKTNDRNNIYFLDIDFGPKASMNGLELAQTIRQLDPLGRIIFITSHSQLAPLTFKYKVEALDFIVKDSDQDLQAQLIEVLKVIIEREKEAADVKKRFAFKQGRRTRVIDYKDILYIESIAQAHKLALVTIKSRFEFYERLKNLENKNEGLVRVHRSFIVNLSHIKSLDRQENFLHLSNQNVIPFAANKAKELNHYLLTK